MIQKIIWCAVVVVIAIYVGWLMGEFHRLFS